MNIIETNVQVLPLKYLHENKGQIESVPANPRILKDDNYKALVESLREDDMTGAFPLKVYKQGNEYIVLGGNMRLKALRELHDNEYAVSCVLIPADVPAEKLRKMVVLDNSTFGEWDMDMLSNEWDADELKDWGVDVPSFASSLTGLLDEANFESLNEIARNKTGLQQVTFLFRKEDADKVNNYIEEHTKAVLVEKIVEICQKQEAK